MNNSKTKKHNFNNNGRNSNNNNNNKKDEKDEKDDKRKDIKAGEFNFLSIDKHPLKKYKGKIEKTAYFGQRLGEYYTKEISIISKLPVKLFKW
jgi:hypothetical protein